MQNCVLQFTKSKVSFWRGTKCSNRIPWKKNGIIKIEILSLRSRMTKTGGKGATYGCL